MTERPIAIAAAVVGIAATLCYANGTLNHFFVTGSNTDAFWFAGLFWRIDLWMTNPPALDGRSYFGTHFSPILFIPGLISWLVPGDPITYFAVANGAMHGIATAAFAGTMALAAQRAGQHVAVAVLICVVAGAALIVLPVQFQFLVLPHFEILIPALLIAFLAALADRRDRLAKWIFVALLMVREDAGLHAAMFLLAWEGAQRLERKRIHRNLLNLAIYGIAWSGLAFLLGPAIAGEKQDIVRGLYLGNPLFAHMTPERIAERVLKFTLERTELWCSIAAIALAAAWRRDLRLAAGAAAVMPWIGLNVGFGSHPANSQLAFYYAFPLLAAFAWPAVRLLMEPRAPGALPRLGALQIAVLMLGFSPPLGPEYHEWKWRWSHATIFDLEGLRQRPHYVAFADAFRQHRGTLGNFAATEDVIGLVPDAMPRESWAEEFDRQNKMRLVRIETLLVFESPGNCMPSAELRHELRLGNAFEVVGTRVVILTRRSASRLAAWGPMLVPKPPDYEPCKRPWH